MFVIVGIFIVFGSVVGGYLMHHGNLAVLIQPNEFVIIGGSAIGALVITCSPKILVKILKTFPSLFKSGPQKKAYLSQLSLLYNIFNKVKKEGALAIERDIEEPEKSPLFKGYPEITKNHHALSFICDNLRIFVVGVNPMEMEEMMDLEMEAHEQEAEIGPAVISKISDSLPGFGIVAAVLGVVITMGKMSEPPEVIGMSVAAALVGTFLGILLSYGLLGPIANHLEHKAVEEGKYLESIKVAILSFSKGSPPQIAVEAARRTLFSDVKPSFRELEESLKKKGSAKKKAA